MPPEETIRQTLASLRTRLNRGAFAEVCAVAFIVGSFTLAFAVLAAVAGGSLGVMLARLTLLSGLVLILGIGWRIWLRPSLHLRSDEAMARWYEGRSGNLNAELITAVQLVNQGLGKESPELSRAILERSRESLAGAKGRDLVRRPRLRWLSLMGFLSVLFVVALAVLFPHVLAKAHANLFDGDAVDGTSGQVVVIERDRVVEGLTLEIQAPSYTGLSVRHSDGTRGRVKALVGSTVLIVGRTMLPAKSAMLILESDPQGRWPVVLGESGVLKASLRVGSSDRYRFALVGDDSRVYLETRWRDVLAQEDALPVARFIKPVTDVQAHPGDQIVLLGEASDDFGVGSVELVVEPPDGKEVRRELTAGKGAREVAVEDVLSVDDLHLLPGEMATFYLEARDGNAVSGAGIGRSQSIRIYMANPEAEHEEFLVDLEKLFDGLIDVLADRLESPVDFKKPSSLGLVADWHDGIVEAQGRILTALEGVFASVGDHTRRKEEVSKLLRRILDSLDAVLTSEKRQLHRIRERDFSAPRPAVQLALLRSINTDGVVQTETAIFALKEWVDQSRQENVLERGREMLSLQNEIHDLLERLKESGNQEFAAEAQRHLDRLDANLRKMEEQMSKLAERVPYENQNSPTQASDKSMDTASMRERIAEAKKLIKEGKIAEAMKLLEELNTDTQQMMARLNEEFKTGKPVTGKGQEELSEVQNALRKLHGGQQELLDETGESLQSRKEEVAEAFKERFDVLQKKAKALEEQLQSIDGGKLHPSDGQGLEGLKARSKRLSKDLEAVDVDSAQRAAQEVGEGASSLHSEIGKSEERELDLKRQSSLRGAMKGLKKGGVQAEELEQELSQLKAELSKHRAAAGGRKQTQKFGKLGKKQGALGKRTGKLQKALRSLEGEVPGIESQLGPELEKAKRSMERAMRELKGQKGSAQGHQRDALERLGKALKGLEDKLKRSQQSEGTTGPNDPREKVAIPDADAYEVPKEFREELLRAMKERAPRKFDKENKRFYEELVK